MNNITFWLTDVRITLVIPLHKVIARCRHIKTPSEYLMWRYDSSDDCPTPLREELLWWSECLCKKHSFIKH